VRLIPLLLALGLIVGCDRQKPEPPQDNEASAPALVEKGVDRSQKGKAAPDTIFKDPSGEDVTMAVVRGRPALVNLWATWCAPCVKELPTLDRLEASIHPELEPVAYTPESQLQVIIISQDMGPQASVEAFLEHLKIKNLGAYHDDKMALSGALGVQVMPTTILYDSDGREVWRYVGDLDWTSAEATQLLSEAK
jgi:thiol-disulfide isomerase/thioredoxin